MRNNDAYIHKSIIIRHLRKTSSKNYIVAGDTHLQVNSQKNKTSWLLQTYKTNQ